MKGLQTGKEGIIFNIQRYSIHDGPGIRTTVFLKGCPLRCRWCANPESISPYPEIFFRKENCDFCGKCMDVCEPKAISMGEISVQLNRVLCNLCMKCEEVCYSGVINRVGKAMTVNDVVREAIKDELFYSNSGGGITISGGEPLYQAKFTLNLLKEFKERALHTTIDTSGYAKWEDLKEILGYTDLILFDIKHLNREVHQEGTGVSNEPILRNFEKTLQRNVRVWARIPIIPEFNDSNQYMEKLAKFLSKRPIEKVSLLKYHEWGKHKYTFLDRDYSLNNVNFISEKKLQDFKNIMESYSLEVTLDY